MKHKIQKNCQKIFQHSVQFLFLISFPDCKSGQSVIAHGFSNFRGGILLFILLLWSNSLRPSKTRNNYFSQTLVMNRLPPIFFFVKYTSYMDE